MKIKRDRIAIALVVVALMIVGLLDGVLPAPLLGFGIIKVFAYLFLAILLGLTLFYEDKKFTKVMLIILAVAGMGIMAYLANLHFSASDSSVCDLGKGVSCSGVNASEYAKVAGIPVSVLGFLYFTLVFGLTLFRYSKKTLKFIGFITIVFLGPSIYLSALEYVVLKEVCIFCEMSKMVMLLIVATSLYEVGKKSIARGFVVGTIILAALTAGVTYLIQNSGGVPDGTYRTFSQCIYDSGLKMYGSAGCSACAKQRAMFDKESFELIQEIECNPRFVENDPQVERCVAKDISKTPTWILEDKNGNTIKAHKAGIMSLEELSEASGCTLLQDTIEI